MSNIPVSVEDLPFNSFHKRLNRSAAGGFLVDGYVISIIGIVLMYITDALKLTVFWEGMIAASSLIGTFVGGFIGGWLSDKIGRKKLFLLTPILFALTSFGNLFVDSALMLFLLRLGMGIIIGIEYPVSSAMLVEYIPRKERGSKLAALTTVWFIGATLAYMIGAIILKISGPEAWRVILASGAVFAIILFFMRLGTPESARWLLGKGRDSEANRVIKNVYGDQFSLANLPEEQTDGEKISFKKFILSGYGKRMFFVLVFWTCAVIPVFAVYAFAPKILTMLKLSGDLSLLGSILITLFFLIGCVFATNMINSLGRRKTLINSFLFSSIALLGLGIFHDSSGIIILFLFIIFALAIGGSQILSMVYPNEIFPTEVRTTACGFASSLSRVGAVIGTYLVPVSLSSLGVAQTMYVAAAVTIFGLVFSWWLAPETKSMSLAEASSLK